MDTDHKPFTHNHLHPTTTTTTITTYFRWPYRLKPPLRRRKPPTIRLGGKKKHRRGFLLGRLFRQARLRWLKLKYSCMINKLKQYYKSMVREIIEASGSIGSVQQRILMESSFAIPVMGVSFNSFPSAYGMDRI